MKLTVKLYAGLGRYLPPGSSDHAAELEIPPDTTAHGIMDRLAMPREAAHLVLLNGVYLNAGQRDEGLLREGDVVAMWPPVAGG